MKQGYSSKEYAEVYSKHGEIFSELGIIRRPIEDTDYHDEVSVYPFYPEYRDVFYYGTSSKKCISGTYISDPLAKDHFLYKSDGYEVYKTHYIVDLQSYDFNKLPENHKRNIKKNDKNVREGHSTYLIPEVVAKVDPIAADMSYVYQDLVKRHNITGYTNYDLAQFKQLIKVPGTVVFRTTKHLTDFHLPSRASYALFYIDKDNVYYHMGFGLEESYKLNANFILMHSAIEFFKRLGLNKLLLGSVPDGGNDGLRRFKEGFSNESRENYILKHIYNEEVYDRLSKDKSTNMFPAYRG